MFYVRLAFTTNLLIPGCSYVHLLRCISYHDPISGSFLFLVFCFDCNFGDRLLLSEENTCPWKEKRLCELDGFATIVAVQFGGDSQGELSVRHALPSST